MGGAMRWLSMVGKWRVTAKSKKKNMIILHNNNTCITTGSNDDDRTSTSCADVVVVAGLIPNCNAAINDTAAADPVDDAAAGHEVEVLPPESDSERAHASAVAIQSLFRGHLARRAFRALRSLVKLQAVVRGVCVRKQACVALRCMHALLRLQARLQASKSTQKTLTLPLI